MYIWSLAAVVVRNWLWWRSCYGTLSFASSCSNITYALEYVQLLWGKEKNGRLEGVLYKLFNYLFMDTKITKNQRNYNVVLQQLRRAPDDFT